MNAQEKKRIFEQLSAPFPEEAIERTDGKQTGRGYNTTGLKAQYVIDRLNTVLGIGGWRVHREVTVREVATSSGRRMYEAVCDMVLELGEWIDDKFHVFAESVAYGGHVAVQEGDARKGSFSNALKRAAAMHGCGAAAYRGELDDDNVLISGIDLPAEPARPTTPAKISVPPGTARTSTLPTTPTRTPAPTRNRLSSKQLAAIWALGRRLGYEQQSLRQFVKGKFGSQPEFLSREQASSLIGAMSEQAGNGHAEEHPEPGAEG